MVTELRVRSVRVVTELEASLAPGLTLAVGPNGSGKSSLLEALYLALTGRSYRTRRQREVISFGGEVARAEATVEDADGSRRFQWSATKAGERRHRLDGAELGADALHLRPPVAVFVPDRLALVKGAPALRRAHLDELFVALWPARAELRQRYGRVLAQRNSLLARARASGIAPESLDAWDAELATVGIELMAARAEACTLLAQAFAGCAADLGLGPTGEASYRPRSSAESVAELADELAARRATDMNRGFTSHGPHLDELEITIDGRAVRRYGSQGEQRAALLALLLAERACLLDAGRPAPLMLLDDVMSELDEGRRRLLGARVIEGEGQALVTATEAGQLPAEIPRAELRLRGGGLISGVEAAA